MKLKVDQQGDVARVTVAGSVDERGAEELKDCLKQVDTGENKEVILDFGGVTYFGSAGVGKLLLFYKRLALSNGRISIVNIPRSIYEGFRAVKLDEIFTLQPA